MTSSTSDFGAVLRPLGAMERMYQLFTIVHPMHFSVVAELDSPLSPRDLEAALAIVSRRHPLLTATVHVDSPGLAVFRGQNARIPVRYEPSGPWERVIEDELATALPPDGAGSSARVVLIQGDENAVLVLTCAHHVADGSSAVRVINDLLAALNGAPLGPTVVPEPRETLFRAIPEIQEIVQQGAPPKPPAVAYERMRIPATYLPTMIPPTRPSVAGVTLSEETVTALRQRAKGEDATVHGALLAATTMEIAEQRRLDLVRIMSPISLLPWIGNQPGTGVFLNAARSAVSLTTVGDFWDLAREHLRQLAPARSAIGIGRASAAFIAKAGKAATPEVAADFMGRGALGLDALVTNLGSVSTLTNGRLAVRKVWGPFVLMQVDGETGISAATHAGEMQLTEVARDADIHVLNGVARRLRDASQLGRTGEDAGIAY